MQNSSSFLWLILGALLNTSSGGRWAIAACAWLAPVFLLHFARVHRRIAGMMWLWLALFASVYWAYRGAIPAPALATVAISAAIALAALLPFLADRLISPRIPGFASTLVFPLAWVAVEFGAARWSPYGTWGALAYTQYGNLALMQLASATGTVGIAFLVAWFASVLNWAWDRDFGWAAVRTGLLVYAVAWSLAMVFGGARLVFGETATRTVRIAAIGWPEGIVARPEYLRALEPDLPKEEREKLRSAFQRVHDYFLEASRREARAGAKILVWPEANAMVFQENESAFLERVQRLAHEENVYVLVGIAAVNSGSDRPLENKAVLIDQAGAVALSYVKAIPVPGFEARISRHGTRQILTSDSAYGRLATAICFDLDYPSYIRQVGASKADLLLVPASDWEAIKLLHHVAAVFRAVENGVPMVRATRWGLSAAVDPQGRVLAEVDAFIAGDHVMVAQVPVGSVSTLYARFGDWFAWLCVAALLVLFVWSRMSAIPHR